MKKMQGLCFAFFVFVQLLSAQDMPTVRQDIDSLTSPYMFGRGYLKDGHLKAAKFIKNRFEALSLSPLIKDGYFQKYSFNVNVIEDVHVGLRAKEFQLGRDYIPDAAIPTYSGKLKISMPDSIHKKDKRYNISCFKGKIPENYDGNYIKRAGDKLTHTFAREQSKNVGFYFTDSAFHLLRKSQRLKVSVCAKISEVESQNVLAHIKGTEVPDTVIIVCAHYDHLGGIGGSCYFPGANDNASGVAMLLQLARYYADPTNAPKYSMVFIAFGSEEVGLIGSKYYVEHPIVPLANTKFVLNLDLMGSGLDGITVVNGLVYKGEFDLLQNINTQDSLVKLVKPRAKAANSDHYYFSEKGVRSFFIYSLGEIKAYHDINDKASTLPLTKFPQMFTLIHKFLNKL